MPSCLWDLNSPTRGCAQASAVTAASPTWTPRGSSGFCCCCCFFFNLEIWETPFQKSENSQFS